MQTAVSNEKETIALLTCESVGEGKVAFLGVGYGEYHSPSVRIRPRYCDTNARPGKTRGLAIR
jgi:hypothetical protein